MSLALTVLSYVFNICLLLYFNHYWFCLSKHYFSWFKSEELQMVAHGMALSASPCLFHYSKSCTWAPVDFLEQHRIEVGNSSEESRNHIPLPCMNSGVLHLCSSIFVQIMKKKWGYEVGLGNFFSQSYPFLFSTAPVPYGFCSYWSHNSQYSISDWRNRIGRKE